jgi:hypothetical protein
VEFIRLVRSISSCPVQSALPRTELINETAQEGEERRRGWKTELLVNELVSVSLSEFRAFFCLSMHARIDTRSVAVGDCGATDRIVPMDFACNQLSAINASGLGDLAEIAQSRRSDL